jgi:transposase InsO family protein
VERNSTRIVPGRHASLPTAADLVSRSTRPTSSGGPHLVRTRSSACSPERTGVRHRYIKPRTPRLNGNVERSHRIDAEEFYRLLDGAVIDDAQIFNHKLQEWEDYYNVHRPHGSLGGQTPDERLRQKTKTPL